MTDGLAIWVEKLRTRYATLREIAELIGMSESGFTRGVKRGTLSVENLLDLARAMEEHPSKVLRLAGKDHVARLIETLYGPGLDSLPESERLHLERWRRLSQRARHGIDVVIADILHENGEEKPAAKKSRRVA